MATSVALALALPKLIVVKSKLYSEKGNAYFKAEGDGGSVAVGENDVFSTLVKIEAERAANSDKYVNLRFCHSNRYWARITDGSSIVAESNQPQEDVKEPGCTLFEPVKVDDNGVFYLSHVASGGRVSVDGPTMAFYVGAHDDESGYLTFVDWNSLVKLPRNVAFKGDNGMYLGGLETNMVGFQPNDRNDPYSNFFVELRPDGYVRIYKEFYKLSCAVMSTGAIEMAYDVADEPRAHFWPVKLDDNTIALRSRSNNLFCERSNRFFADCLSASAPAITKPAILQVQEQVQGRKIYSVRYQMEYARIFDETPYLAGSSTLTNDRDEEASMGVEITYTDERTYTFSRSVSLTAGISSTIEASLPFIESASITVSYEINGTFQWDEGKTTTTSIMASGSVSVPARTTAVIDYVGTKGTCNIPYSYTQQDQSSTDGKTTYTDLFDGTYTGVNCYNFNFHVRSALPL